MVVGPQPLAQRDKLIDFAFQRLELRIHNHTIVSKTLIGQHLTLFFESGLISGPWALGYNHSVVAGLR